MSTTHSRSRRRCTSLTFLPVLLAACTNAPPSHDAVAAASAGEVVLPQGSPKRAYLAIAQATTTTDHVIATLPAQISADEDHTVHVGSPVAGRVVAVFVHAGDRVAQGQPLATIRSADAGLARSDLAKARASLTIAQRTLARTRDLVEHRVAAARDLEQAESDEAQANAEFGRALSRSHQLGLGNGGGNDEFTLRAPMAGTILDRSASEGMEVRPDLATALFTVTSLANVWLSVGVSQHDLALVHLGSRLRFTPETDPTRTYEGRVSYVSNALDPNTRTATVRAVLPNPGGALRVLTSGQAQVVSSEGAPSIVLPTRALVTHGTETVVFVEVTPGRFVRRVVTVRDDDGTTATIATGLSPGERVVVDGSLQLDAETPHGT